MAPSCTYVSPTRLEDIRNELAKAGISGLTDDIIVGIVTVIQSNNDVKNAKPADVVNYINSNKISSSAQTDEEAVNNVVESSKLAIESAVANHLQSRNKQGLESDVAISTAALYMRFIPNLKGLPEIIEMVRDAMTNKAFADKYKGKDEYEIAAELAFMANTDALRRFNEVRDNNKAYKKAKEKHGWTFSAFFKYKIQPKLAAIRRAIRLITAPETMVDTNGNYIGYGDIILRAIKRCSVSKGNGVEMQSSLSIIWNAVWKDGLTMKRPLSTAELANVVADITNTGTATDGDLFGGVKFTIDGSGFSLDQIKSLIEHNFDDSELSGLKKSILVKCEFGNTGLVDFEKLFSVLGITETDSNGDVRIAGGTDEEVNNNIAYYGVIAGAICRSIGIQNIRNLGALIRVENNNTNTISLILNKPFLDVATLFSIPNKDIKAIDNNKDNNENTIIKNREYLRKLYTISDKIADTTKALSKTLSDAEDAIRSQTGSSQSAALRTMAIAAKGMEYNSVATSYVDAITKLIETIDGLVSTFGTEKHSGDNITRFGTIMSRIRDIANLSHDETLDLMRDLNDLHNEYFIVIDSIIGSIENDGLIDKDYEELSPAIIFALKQAGISEEGIKEMVTSLNGQIGSYREIRSAFSQARTEATLKFIDVIKEQHGLSEEWAKIVRAEILHGYNDMSSFAQKLGKWDDARSNPVRMFNKYYSLAISTAKTKATHIRNKQTVLAKRMLEEDGITQDFFFETTENGIPTGYIRSKARLGRFAEDLDNAIDNIIRNLNKKHEKDAAIWPPISSQSDMLDFQMVEFKNELSKWAFGFKKTNENLSDEEAIESGEYTLNPRISVQNLGDYTGETNEEKTKSAFIHNLTYAEFDDYNRAVLQSLSDSDASIRAKYEKGEQLSDDDLAIIERNKIARASLGSYFNSDGTPKNEEEIEHVNNYVNTRRKLGNLKKPRYDVDKFNRDLQEFASSTINSSIDNAIQYILTQDPSATYDSNVVSAVKEAFIIVFSDKIASGSDVGMLTLAQSIDNEISKILTNTFAAQIAKELADKLRTNGVYNIINTDILNWVYPRKFKRNKNTFYSKVSVSKKSKSKKSKKLDTELYRAALSFYRKNLLRSFSGDNYISGITMSDDVKKLIRTLDIIIAGIRTNNGILDEVNIEAFGKRFRGRVGAIDFAKEVLNKCISMGDFVENEINTNAAISLANGVVKYDENTGERMMTTITVGSEQKTVPVVVVTNNAVVNSMNFSSLNPNVKDFIQRYVSVEYDNDYLVKNKIMYESNGRLHAYSLDAEENPGGKRIAETVKKPSTQRMISKLNEQVAKNEITPEERDRWLKNITFTVDGETQFLSGLTNLVAVDEDDFEWAYSREYIIDDDEDENSGIVGGYIPNVDYEEDGELVYYDKEFDEKVIKPGENGKSAAYDYYRTYLDQKAKLDATNGIGNTASSRYRCIMIQARSREAKTTLGLVKNWLVRLGLQIKKFVTLDDDYLSDAEYVARHIETTSIADQVGNKIRKRQVPVSRRLANMKLLTRSLDMALYNYAKRTIEASEYLKNNGVGQTLFATYNVSDSNDPQYIQNKKAAASYAKKVDTQGEFMLSPEDASQIMDNDNNQSKPENAIGAFKRMTNMGLYGGSPSEYKSAFMTRLNMFLNGFGTYVSYIFVRGAWKQTLVNAIQGAQEIFANKFGNPANRGFREKRAARWLRAQLEDSLNMANDAFNPVKHSKILYMAEILGLHDSDVYNIEYRLNGAGSISHTLCVSFLDQYLNPTKGGIATMFETINERYATKRAFDYSLIPYVIEVNGKREIRVGLFNFTDFQTLKSRLTAPDSDKKSGEKVVGIFKPSCGDFESINLDAAFSSEDSTFSTFICFNKEGLKEMKVQDYPTLYDKIVIDDKTHTPKIDDKYYKYIKGEPLSIVGSRLMALEARTKTAASKQETGDIYSNPIGRSIMRMRSWLEIIWYKVYGHIGSKMFTFSYRDNIMTTSICNWIARDILGKGIKYITGRSSNTVFGHDYSSKMQAQKYFATKELQEYQGKGASKMGRGFFVEMCLSTLTYAILDALVSVLMVGEDDDRLSPQMQLLIAVIYKLGFEQRAQVPAFGAIDMAASVKDVSYDFVLFQQYINVTKEIFSEDELVTTGEYKGMTKLLKALSIVSPARDVLLTGYDMRSDMYYAVQQGAPMLSEFIASTLYADKDTRNATHDLYKAKVKAAEMHSGLLNNSKIDVNGSLVRTNGVVSYMPEYNQSLKTGLFFEVINDNILDNNAANLEYIDKRGGKIKLKPALDNNENAVYFNDVKTNNEKTDMILRDYTETINKDLIKDAKEIINETKDKDIQEFCRAMLLAINTDHEYNIKHNEKSPLNMKKELTTVSAIWMYDKLKDKLVDRDDNLKSFKKAQIISTMAAVSYIKGMEKNVVAISCNKDPDRVADMMEKDADLLKRIGIIKENNDGLYVDKVYFKSIMDDTGFSNLSENSYKNKLKTLTEFCNAHNNRRSYLNSVGDGDLDIANFRDAGDADRRKLERMKNNKIKVKKERADKILDDCIENRRNRLLYNVLK